MEMSEQVNELATALSAAQSEIEGATKDKINPAFRSKYADLGSVVDACKAALVKHGLSFTQVFEPSAEGTLMLTTMLLHQSGQWLRGTCLMPLAKVDPQGYGSAATYARRYGLAAIVGVCPEDDDGNAASGRQDTYQGRQQQPSRQAESRGDTAAAVARTERPLAPSSSPARAEPPVNGVMFGGEDQGSGAKPFCADCKADGKHTELPSAVAVYSKAQFGKCLCRPHQDAARKSATTGANTDPFG